MYFYTGTRKVLTKGDNTFVSGHISFGWGRPMQLIPFYATLDLLHIQITVGGSGLIMVLLCNKDHKSHYFFYYYDNV